MFNESRQPRCWWEEILHQSIDSIDSLSTIYYRGSKHPRFCRLIFHQQDRLLNKSTFCFQFHKYLEEEYSSSIFFAWKIWNMPSCCSWGHGNTLLKSGTWKCWFRRWISPSRYPFSGSMLVSGVVQYLWIFLFLRFPSFKQQINVESAKPRKKRTSTSKTTRKQKTHKCKRTQIPEVSNFSLVIHFWHSFYIFLACSSSWTFEIPETWFCKKIKQLQNTHEKTRLFFIHPLFLNLGLLELLEIFCPSKTEKKTTFQHAKIEDVHLIFLIAWLFIWGFPKMVVPQNGWWK